MVPAMTKNETLLLEGLCGAGGVVSVTALSAVVVLCRRTRKAAAADAVTGTAAAAAGPFKVRLGTVGDHRGHGQMRGSFLRNSLRRHSF